MGTSARAGLLAVTTIVVGLAVHRGLPASAARDVAGDALWAMMLHWWITALRPQWSIGARAATAMALCALVETSQLVHTPTLDAVRATTMGHLVLGSGFDPRDFAAYALGVAVAALLDSRVLPHRVA